MRRRGALALALAASVLAVQGVRLPVANGSRSSVGPLIGTNYTHYSNNGGCSAGAATSLDGTGIVANYWHPGVAALVRRQLAVMRARGIQTLRLILWHATDVHRTTWGAISSAGGKLNARDRAGLVGYFRAVRVARFARLTLSFGPVSSNAPSSSSYDPTKIDENWAFLVHVRALLKRYGPRSTHIDLLNEATQNDAVHPNAAQRVDSYLSELYRRYVLAYGSGDVSVSVIASQGPADIRTRLNDLVAALRQTGLPLPLWFDVHISYNGDEALTDLQIVDATLSSDGLSQPLVISEAAYNDGPTAQAIASFTQHSQRPVLEVIEWPLQANSSCQSLSVSPPYRANAYLGALRG
jgi:hypothetical protein